MLRDRGWLHGIHVECGALVDHLGERLLDPLLAPSQYRGDFVLDLVQGPLRFLRMHLDLTARLFSALLQKAVYPDPLVRCHAQLLGPLIHEGRKALTRFRVGAGLEGGEAPLIVVVVAPEIDGEPDASRLGNATSREYVDELAASRQLGVDEVPLDPLSAAFRDVLQSPVE